MHPHLIPLIQRGHSKSDEGQGGCWSDELDLANVSQTAISLIFRYALSPNQIPPRSTFRSSTPSLLSPDTAVLRVLTYYQSRFPLAQRPNHPRSPTLIRYLSYHRHNTISTRSYQRRLSIITSTQPQSLCFGFRFSDLFLFNGRPSHWISHFLRRTFINPFGFPQPDYAECRRPELYQTAQDVNEV